MDVHVGDWIDVLDLEGQASETHRIVGIFLHHDLTVHPEGLTSIDPSLFRTLNQDYLGVRVELLLDNGEELCYGDLEQHIAIAKLEQNHDDDVEINR